MEESIICTVHPETSDLTEVKIDVNEKTSKIMYVKGFRSNGDY